MHYKSDKVGVLVRKLVLTPLTTGNETMFKTIIDYDNDKTDGSGEQRGAKYLEAEELHNKDNYNIQE